MRPRRSSERWLLGPASLRRGLLEAVGEPPFQCDGYECGWSSGSIEQCCTRSDECSENTECVTTNCEPEDHGGRRNIRFGYDKETIQGQCVCTNDSQWCREVVNGISEGYKCVDDDADLNPSNRCPCDDEFQYCQCAGCIPETASCHDLCGR